MSSVPRQRHFYGLNQLHYLTSSTYRRARLFDSERFKRHFVTTWQDLRTELSFRIIGYILMPEHFHILLWPSELANPSQIMQKLEDRTAKFILKNLRHNRQFAWCERMLHRLEFPPTVHHHAHHRVWPRRFYDFNVWSDNKIKEKLDYMHNNPVDRRLVEKPGDWPWSSWRFYYMEDCSVLAMDRIQ
jgi:putative transposase